MNARPLDDDEIACAGIVQRGDPSRFMAAMAAPVVARRVLFPIYAFNVEVARAPWLTEEPMIAEMRLQWWRDALEEIRAGGPVRRHEVVTPLARILDADGAALLDTLIAARRWDIYKDAFEDAAHFDRYLTETSAHLMLVAARALGPAEASPVLDAGYAAGLAGFLRAIPQLEAAKRVPLVDGRPAAITELARDGLARLQRARTARGNVSRAAAPAMLAAWQAGAVLRRAAMAPERVAHGTLPPAPIRDRVSLMIRSLSGKW
ncbi:squalene/phytoene synthase family protein [Pseudohalocynthiibacter aestuariivivens]|nr:squalene/phytoene synthase family protein [Pseudohalocynthiibacter aestuariivivens]QIE45947.1 squalene/phytoene synthase family protein [Pseudohalocynthiibacter aestuariivivens]